MRNHTASSTPTVIQKSLFIYIGPFFFFSLRSMLETQTPPSLTGIPFTEAPYQLEAKCKTDQLQHAHHLAVGKISTTNSQKRPKGEPTVDSNNSSHCCQSQKHGSIRLRLSLWELFRSSLGTPGTKSIKSNNR